MIMGWFNFKTSTKHKPPFWLDYLSSFKSPVSPYFVAFDCETTGLDTRKDKLLSIGAVRFTADRILVHQSMELMVHQDNVDESSVKIHGILPSTTEEAERSEQQVIKHFLAFIGNSYLVGHHIRFDVAMIDQALKRMGLGKLKNRTHDTNLIFKQQNHYPLEQNISLDDLCAHFRLKAENRHTALGDAYLTAVIHQRLTSDP